MHWDIIDTGLSSAVENMERDSELLEKLDPSGPALLHLYEWEKPSATYGYFTDPAIFLDLEAARRQGLDLARRPTGGGIVFHITDFAFSVLVPAGHPAFSLNTMENYAFINRHVIQVVEQFCGESVHPSLLPQEPQALDAASRHFCMAKPTKFDVMVHGLKVGGAAQRRRRQGYLHQGTISLAPVAVAYLRKVLQPKTQVLQAMEENSFSLLPQCSQEELSRARHEIKNILISVFC